MRWITTGLEIAACACLLGGAYILAGVGALLIAGSGALFAASYVLSRGSR